MNSIFDYEHPFVCTDAIIFTIKTNETDNYRRLPETSLRILLYKRAAEPYQTKWCLPGGFLNIDEMPEDSIRRILSEKSNVEIGLLEQLYTFCDMNRDPRARVLSIAYFGLMNETESKKFGNKAVWFTVGFNADRTLRFESGEHALSDDDLGFDHSNMIKIALERLRSKILYTTIVFNLLPEEFTLTQLQNVYEAILGRKDQAANFRRKIMNTVRETGRMTGDKGHRPAKLYTKKEGGTRT
jgi:ADP-ribose pyrophosphatase YjhB (NUDIX family)